jgi:hypothetical protein
LESIIGLLKSLKIRALSWCSLKTVCAQARALLEPKADAFVQAPDDGALMASYSVFVVEPGSLPGTNPSVFFLFF